MQGIKYDTIQLLFSMVQKYYKQNTQHKHKIEYHLICLFVKINKIVKQKKRQATLSNKRKERTVNYPQTMSNTNTNNMNWQTDEIEARVTAP